MLYKSVEGRVGCGGRFAAYGFDWFLIGFVVGCVIGPSSSVSLSDNPYKSAFLLTCCHSYCKKSLA